MKPITNLIISLLLIAFSAVGCAELDTGFSPSRGPTYYRGDPYRDSYREPYYGGNGYYRDDYRRERHELREEREDLERERRDLERQRERERREERERDKERQREQNQQLHRPAEQPPPRKEEMHCPAGYSPSERKCTPEERKRGCKDVRLDNGLGCVHRP